MTHVCRRICFLRERGDLAQAEQLETVDLAAALARCRNSHDDTVIAARLHAIFSAESERVATAAVIAEFLLPHVVASTSPAPALASLAPFEPAPHASASGAFSAAPAAIPARPSAGADIAAFIDQMLAMDDPDHPPPHRRAS